MATIRWELALVVAEGDFAADEDEVAEAMHAHAESLRGEGD